MERSFGTGERIANDRRWYPSVIIRYTDCGIALRRLRRSKRRLMSTEGRFSISLAKQGPAGRRRPFRSPSRIIPPWRRSPRYNRGEKRKLGG